MSVYITREQDYALRVCIYLSHSDPGAVIPIAGLARAVAISRPIATKIVYQLKQHGLIGTTKGKNGGAYLMKKPNHIRLLDVLKAMGFQASINECLKIPGVCPFHEKCKVHRFFDGMNRELLAKLHCMKISDFV